MTKTTTKSITITATELETIISSAVAAALAANGTPKESEAPSKKGKGGKKSAPKVRLVTNRNMAAFRRDSGTKFRKAVCVAEAVRDGKLKLPEGWAFGPVYDDYVFGTVGRNLSREEYFKLVNS